MNSTKMLDFIGKVVTNIPEDWLKLTTHRLDIYEEKLAKVQFLEQFEHLYNSQHAEPSALQALPTAFDYIRLGHPLSCVLEWGIGHLLGLSSEQVISFSSKTTPILAVLRKNLFAKKNTQILYTGDLADFLDADLIRSVYGYSFELRQVDSYDRIPSFDGSTLSITQDDFRNISLKNNVDFILNIHNELGAVILVNGEANKEYIPNIQHVRRRETIAMTPANCLSILKTFSGTTPDVSKNNIANTKSKVKQCIKEISGTSIDPHVGSSGLSVQYAIMMGLVDHALAHHQGKKIVFIVPPNCYGGTNDQARRVAACLDGVEVVDLPVDGGNDMVQGINKVLDQLAKENAVPYIIAEIPTNPRVEVPDLVQLKAALSKTRKTASGEVALDPVFILDQTFCPNIHFLGEGEILSTVRTISYTSGSKFPSGGRCTAGYCVGNNMTDDLMQKIGWHLLLCDNEATTHQYEVLAEQMPSMNQRIHAAYLNTREFVNYIKEVLPTAKINFVSQELAAQGFTPSVFSLDLATKGNSDAEKETYKRALNHKLINLMITKIPNESKHCVSYGQVKGCYWTIPATSTQGTTKEADKDYIARVALSGEMDLAKHKEVFLEFVEGEEAVS